MAKIVIDAWSDVICPWCWIGDVRLEKALQSFRHRAEIEIRHRSYRLMPGVTPQPVVSLMSRKTGGSEASVHEMFAQVEAVARSEGLHYNIARTIAGDTIDAHRIIQLANRKGLGSAVFERFYRAHFVEGLSIFNHENLRNLAVEAGLSADEVIAVLAGDQFRREVESDQEAANTNQVQGVPFYVIGRYAVSGAQPTEMFAEALSRASADQALHTRDASPSVCGPDGCY